LAPAPVRWHMMATALQAASKEKVGSIPSWKDQGVKERRLSCGGHDDHWDKSEMMKQL
jgi:hypothetical protein